MPLLVTSAHAETEKDMGIITNRRIKEDRKNRARMAPPKNRNATPDNTLEAVAAYDYLLKNSSARFRDLISLR